MGPDEASGTGGREERLSAFASALSDLFSREKSDKEDAPNPPYERRHDLRWVARLIEGRAEDSVSDTRDLSPDERKLVAFDRGDEIVLRGVCPYCHHDVDDAVLIDDEREERKLRPRLKSAVVDTFHDRPIESRERAAEARSRQEGGSTREAREAARNSSTREMLLVSRCVDVDPDETLTQADASSVLTVIACNCESEHTGRPEGKLGCGRYGGLLVKLDRTPKEENSDGSPEDPQEENAERSGQGTQPEGKAGEQRALLKVKAEPASAGDKRWDELSDETPYNTLATARALAEKWSATVATLLSLLGVASFLAAKDQLLKVEGPWDWLAGIAALFSLLAAVLATASAARAAQGGLRRAREVTGDVVRQVHREGTEATANLMLLSRCATVVSILLAAAALGFTLYGPE